jgi:hypothetical protein
MRAPRDILKHVTVEAAKAKRKCYRNNKHSILKGELCVVIQESNFGGSKNYCVTCSEAILNAAANRIRALLSEVSNTE